jgi:hypothetical protein
MPISKIIGFRDEQTGLVTANTFTVGLLDPDEVEQTWRVIEKDEELPVKPVMELIGLVGFPEG